MGNIYIRTALYSPDGTLVLCFEESQLRLVSLQSQSVVQTVDMGDKLESVHGWDDFQVTWGCDSLQSIAALLDYRQCLPLFEMQGGSLLPACFQVRMPGARQFDLHNVVLSLDGRHLATCRNATTEVSGIQSSVVIVSCATGQLLEVVVPLSYLTSWLTWCPSGLLATNSVRTVLLDFT